MRRSSSDCPAVWVHRAFESPWVAFASLSGVMLLLVAVYLGIHCSREPPKPPWGDAVKVSDDGRFQPRFQKAILERFFSEKELIRGQDIINQRCGEARKEALTKRRQLLGEIQVFYQRRHSKYQHVNREPLLKHGTTPETNNDAWQMSAKLNTLSCGLAEAVGAMSLLEKDASEWKDEDVLILELSNVSTVLQTMLLDAGAAIREKGNVLVTKVQHLAKEEAGVRDEITAEIRALEPPLSFTWLYHKGSGWIFEVVFWTWFGVIANSFITVIVKCREKEYSPSLFSLVIPKFFLAPLLSVIFVSLWAAGVTEEKVTFLNLPWFMALCFFLGFMTETLYARLRKFADAFLGGVTEASGALPGGPGRDYHQWRHTLVYPSDITKPTTLAELEKEVERQAQAEMEHTIVEAKARENE